MSFYWWTVCAFKLRRQAEKINEQREFLMGLERNTMTLIANANRDARKHPQPYTPQDFYQLSSDRQVDKPIPRSDQEIMILAKERFRKYIKNG